MSIEFWKGGGVSKVERRGSDSGISYRVDDGDGELDYQIFAALG